MTRPVQCYICNEMHDESFIDVHVRTAHNAKSTSEEYQAAFQRGTKHDTQKPRWSLLPLGIIAQVIAVLEFGAQKYSVGNWAHVPEARTRYYDATMRHIEAWWTGETNDPESGLPHLAHAVCCLLFLMWFDKQGETQCYPASDRLQRQLDENKRKHDRMDIVDSILHRSDAEKWLARLRNGEMAPPDADSVPFPDGSRVVWDGMSWELGKNDNA